MKPTQFHPAFSRFALILALAPTATATAAQLSLRFAGGGNEITLAYGETATLELVWRMDATDTSKSGTRITGLSTRFNVVDGEGTDIAGLWMESVTGLAGWELFNSNGVPFTEGDFYLDLYDPAGTGVAGDGTVFDTVLASFEVRNDVVEAANDAFVTFRHAGPADPLPSAENGAAYWSFPWQSEVVMAGQFDLGPGNPGDDDPVWNPYHGYETFQPLTIHLTGGSSYVATPSCTDQWWTWTSHFQDGSDSNRVKGINIDYSTPNQISVNVDPEQLDPLRYLWVACSGRGTVVRIDTETSPPRVVGEYLSTPGDFPSSPPPRFPSRSAVDLFGNAWIGNRDVSDNNRGSVVKIGLVIGGTWVNINGIDYLEPPFDYCTCADRTGPNGIPDGRIQTSTGPGDILAWPDITDSEGSACGSALVEDAEDECILIYQRVQATNVRHVSVDADTNVWIGSSENGRFELLSGETGEILDAFQAIDDLGQRYYGYGGLVDGNGLLWSSTPGSHNSLMRYDTLNGDIQFVDNTRGLPGTNSEADHTYGMGINPEGNIWVSQWLPPSEGRVMKLHSDGSLFENFPRIYSDESNQHCSYDRGILVHPHDRSVWIANSGGGTYPAENQWVSRLNSDGSLDEQIDLGSDGKGPSGLTVDRSGKVWVTCYTSGTVKRINPDNNQVESGATVNLGSSAQPYNYSDMTGITALSVLKYGMWTAVHDSGVLGARWNRVDWNNGNCQTNPEPEGTSIRVHIRASDTEAGLTREPFVEVFSTNPMSKPVVGRFAQVRAMLMADRAPGSTIRPVLCNVVLYNFGDPSRDCNGNGTFDSCEFDDCNANCIPDNLENGYGPDRDDDGDGVLDGCQPIIYVDAAAPGSPHDGTSWWHAFTNLEDALVAAELTTGAADRIWVAEGVYTPTLPTDLEYPQSATFRLRDGVAIYGGFAGTESYPFFDLSERDFVAHETILSGDLGDDDTGAFINTDDNAFHVISTDATDASAILDGVTIQAGNASWGALDMNGAGMNITCDGSPTIRNCVFKHNSAEYWGGGLSLEGGSPRIINCGFEGNRSLDYAHGGGGMAIRNGATPTLDDCRFADNAAFSGAGVYSDASDPTVRTTTFLANLASSSGGGMVAANDSSTTLIKCSFVGNTADPLSNTKGGGLLVQYGGIASIVNCLFSGNDARYGGGVDVQHADAVMTNCTFSDNSASVRGGAVEASYDPSDQNHQQNCSATIANSILWGNAALSGPQIANSGDFGQNRDTTITVDHSDISGGTAQVDLSGGGTRQWLAGNLGPNENPLFQDPNGADDIAGTEDDNFRLNGGPCANAGHDPSVPSYLLTDLDGNARIAGVAVDMGAYETCAMVLDPQKLMDAEPDCDVDLSDFASFQVCCLPGAPADAGCAAAFDRELPCGIIDLHDFADGDYSFDVQLSGPGQGCGESMFGGQNALGESVFGTGDGDETTGNNTEPPPPTESAWMTEESPVAVEIRPLGGGTAVSVLAVGAAYEVCYSGATHALEGYALWIRGTCGAQCLVAASAASPGPWSNTELFAYLSSDGELGSYELVLDDLPLGLSDAASAGRLCIIQPASADELTFDLRLYLTESETSTTYEMVGSVIVEVTEP